MTDRQNEIETSKGMSRAVFEKFVRPVLERHFKTENIFSMENCRNLLEHCLDRLFGIDTLVATSTATFGVGNRIQWGKNYGATSIRFERKSGKDTEYQKDCEVLAGKVKHPMASYKLHGFAVEDDSQADIAIAPTAEIYATIKRNPNRWRETKSGEKFFYVPWREINGVAVYRVNTLRDGAQRVTDVTGEYKRSAQNEI